MQALIPQNEIKASAKLLGWDKEKLWDAELAAKLIAIGGPVDLAEALELDASEPPAPLMATAFGLCLKRIHLEHAADENFRLVSEPQAWLEWAIENDYTIDHLTPFLHDQSGSSESAEDEINGYKWADLFPPYALINAFGFSTGMDASWFDKLEGPLLRARVVKGQSGRGRSTAPLFCPYQVMIWLIDPKRKKGRPLSESKGWRILKERFPAIHDKYQIGDPNDI